jgi:predicted nucleotidyltransferase
MNKKLTEYPKVDEVIYILLSNMQDILGSKLIGLYLDGSLVLGDFDPKVSDIDLTAILENDLDDQEFELLKKKHEELVNNTPEWDDRIEVCYISKEALNSVRTKIMPIVNISPGEPFHRTETQKEWLMNWYLIREKSITIFGSDPNEVIDPISKDEFIQNVKAHTEAWGDGVKNMKSKYAQAYAILTICRALYAYKNGDQVSKKQAAEWTIKELPEYKSLIQNALLWRDNEKKNKQEDMENYPNTEKFVNYVKNLILTS